MREIMILQLSNIKKSFSASVQTRSVLNTVSFDVKPREFVAILGINGSGKSTLLKIIAQLIQPDAGELRVDPATKIGYLAQNPPLLPWKTVLENVLMVRKPINSPACAKAQQCLELIGLSGFENYKPRELSGGMRARTALAQLLCLEPDLFLLDEPFASVDEITRDKLVSEFLVLWESKSSSAVFVTHSISEAVYMADKIIFLKPNAQAGSTAEIIEVPFPRPRSEELKNNPKFLELVSLLRSKSGLAGSKQSLAKI